jgi:hypothetical protein
MGDVSPATLGHSPQRCRKKKRILYGRRQSSNAGSFASAMPPKKTYPLWETSVQQRWVIRLSDAAKKNVSSMGDNSPAQQIIPHTKYVYLSIISFTNVFTTPLFVYFFYSKTL